MRILKQLDCHILPQMNYLVKIWRFFSPWWNTIYSGKRNVHHLMEIHLNASTPPPMSSVWHQLVKLFWLPKMVKGNFITRPQPGVGVLWRGRPGASKLFSRKFCCWTGSVSHINTEVSVAATTCLLWTEDFAYVDSLTLSKEQTQSS